MISTIEIARTPDDVYAFVTDPRHFPDWQRDVVGVETSGGRFTTTRRFARATRTLTQEIVRDEPPYRWAARGIDGPIRPHAGVAIDPIDGGTRSRVTFTLDFEAHGIGVPLLPVVRRQAERAAPTSYANLKRLLEAR
jgi:uncharacterized protein YndB with AHSA1/START domain